MMAIEISPILDAAWEVLQWTIKWIWLVCLIVAVVMVAGAVGDEIAEAIRNRRSRKGKGKTGSPKRSAD